MLQRPHVVSILVTTACLSFGCGVPSHGTLASELRATVSPQPSFTPPAAIATLTDTPQPSATATPEFELPNGSEPGCLHYDSSTRSTAFEFSPDSSLLAVVYSNPTSIVLWDMKTGERVQTLEYSDPINRPPTGIADFGFGLDEGFLTLTALGRLDLWDLDTATFRSLTEERGPYRYFTLSLDRSLMALGSALIDNRILAVTQGIEIKAVGVEIWDTKTLKLQRTLADANPPYAFGPDGKTLATLSGVSFMISIADPGPPVIWQLATGERRELSVKGFPLNLGYSPDGKTLAIYTQPIGSSGILGTLLLSTEDGQVKQTIPGVPAVFFSPDGSLVAGVDYSEISLWDVETGNRLFTLPGGALDIGFSPDWRLLAAVSGSGCITLWNVNALVHN